jgi:uncharacterized lipoprotein YajG
MTKFNSMNMKLFFTGMICLSMLISCGETKKSAETEAPVAAEQTKSETPASDTDNKSIDIVSAMKSKLKAKGYEMSEAQLSQVQSIVDELGIDLSDGTGDFKGKLKTLRQRIYNEVLTEDQMAQFGDKMPKMD